MTTNIDLYDQVLYPTRPNPGAAPLRLATLARLFGMKPRSLQQMRVLELGCGTGGNMFALADSYPQAQFYGVDRAQKPIEAGRQFAQRAGLENLTLQCGDLMDFDVSLGPFDFIIAHGLYSWVPEAVRDRLLKVCHDTLSPHGIAYISYNTYPGWYLQNYARDVMLFHGRNAQEPAARLKAAYEALDLVAEEFPDTAHHFRDFLRFMRDELRRVDPNYLFHDHLAEINNPVYFTDFVNHAGSHGLQYLWEAEHGDRVKSGVSPDVINQLRGTLVECEQTLDFLRGRRFRQTLLCRSDVTLTRESNPELLQGMLIRGDVRSEPPQPDLGINVAVDFHAGKGIRIASADPLVKATLIVLRDHFPRPIGVEELRTEVETRLMESTGTSARATEEETSADLATMLYACHLNAMVELFAEPIPCVFAVSEFPRASNCARLQSQADLEVTNQLHLSLKLADPFAKSLLWEVDGSKSVEQLVALMTEKVALSQVPLPSAAHANSMEHTIPELVHSILNGFAAEGLLVE